jgi:hypothetical protein
MYLHARRRRDSKMCVLMEHAVAGRHIWVRMYLNRSPGLSDMPIFGAQGTGVGGSRVLCRSKSPSIRAVEIHEYINVRSLSYRVASVVRIYGRHGGGG